MTNLGDVRVLTGAGERCGCGAGRGMPGHYRERTWLTLAVYHKAAGDIKRHIAQITECKMHKNDRMRGRGNPYDGKGGNKMDILAEVIGELAHLTEAELYSLLQFLRALRRNSRLEYENDAL